MNVNDDIVQDWRWQPLREVAGGCLLAMELLVAVFWFSAIARGYKPVNLAGVMLVLGVILGGGYVLERSSHTWRVSLAKRRWILFAAWVFSLWVGLECLVYFPAVPGPLAIGSALFHGFAAENLVPLDFWALVVVMLVWGRSQALAHAPTDSDRVLSSFSLVMLSLLGYQFFPQRIPPITVSWLIFAIVFFGLAALGAVRIAVLTEMRGGKQTLASRGWMTGLAISALLVATITALLALVVRGAAGQIVIRAFAILLGVLGGAMTLLLYPLSRLVAALIYWLQGLFSSMPEEKTPLRDILKGLQQLFNIPQTDVSPLDPVLRAIKPATMWAVLILIGLGIITAFGLQIYRERKRRLDSAPTQLSPGDILRELSDAARQKARELKDDLLERLKKLPGVRLLQAVRIRFIYSELMGLCSDLKHPRQGAVTPLEFLPEMAALFDGAAVDLETITQAYLRVRYGELSETHQDVQMVVAAWERVKALGKKTITQREPTK